MPQRRLHQFVERAQAQGVERCHLVIRANECDERIARSVRRAFAGSGLQLVEQSSLLFDGFRAHGAPQHQGVIGPASIGWRPSGAAVAYPLAADGRSEEHTSELQTLMRISYAV